MHRIAERRASHAADCHLDQVQSQYLYAHNLFLVVQLIIIRVFSEMCLTSI